MKTKLAAAAALSLLLAVSGFAHRLDEYLQATILSIEKGRVHAFMRLIPGVAVFPAVLANIDTNRDGAISDNEQQSYAHRVLDDLLLTIDSHPIKPRLTSVTFPTIKQMKEGLGEIQIEFTADLPAGRPQRTLILENHHQRRISAYLVNCLVPQDRAIKVIAQNRNQNQSFYRLEYLQPVAPLAANRWSAAFLPGTLGGAPATFRLGMRHIAEGTDHLLFLLTLLLPAPLVAFRSRWGGFAGTGQSLMQILRVTTAFTIGHSITLAFAAFGFVRAPGRPVEVLIAVSILISAAHAVRPLFPKREAVIAAFFGLIHGLAFAATLEQLGIGWRERVVGVLGFNAGIETMQFLVIAATMPSLLLLSRTRAYPVLRIAGASFGGLASVAWIGERLAGLHTSVDLVVNAAARQAVWVAAALLLISLASQAYSPIRMKLQSA